MNEGDSYRGKWIKRTGDFHLKFLDLLIGFL